MGKALIVVESPAKIKTLKKFLGSNYIFESSLGHIRDLPKKGFGIDVENDFEPQYALLPDKKEVVDRLQKAAKSVDIVYLSPDPDREGEAIAWHIAAILPKGTKFKRVTFNSITKEAVLDALQHPRAIDQSLVDAQQARRMLDRIVGYKISPILTRRVQGARDGGLSAGRVQSVALKMVVDREKEIDAFVPIEYWNIGSMLQADKKHQPFFATLHSIDGKRVEKELIPGKDITTVPDEKTAHTVVSKLQNAVYTVENVEKKEKKRNPVAPFITSTLQQEASRHYGFSASRTMNIAQGLYEGIDLGNEGAEGLITYMRTDSVRIAPEAIDAARGYIAKQYGKEYLPSEGRQYSSKKSAQDAHEAIRPTNLQHSPEELQRYLTVDQFKLYQLIWRRFLASQMTPAIYDTVSCDIGTDKGILLRATGSIIKFKGFLAVYEEKQDRAHTEEKEDQDKILPPLQAGQKLQLLEVESIQAFTRPPPRFTEASLVKELEKSGIGRPSTYATIMNKIQSRDYTEKEKGTLKPTELGKVIAQMLEDNFKMIMDIGFTAAMEDDLENIAENHKEWKALIRDFWDKFIPTVETAEKEAHVPRVLTDIDCPDCGHKLQKIWSRKKYFYGCSNYPECKFTAPLESLNFDRSEYDPSFDWEQNCPKCGSKMQMRFGKFGPFLGCTKYPECKGIVNIPKKDEIPAKDMPTCPAHGCDGKMVQRRSRFGKPFFSCSNYPDCDVIVNDLDDLDEKYPDHPKTPYVKKQKKWGKKGAKTKEPAADKKAPKKKASKKTAKKQPALTLSAALQAVTGEKELSRPEVVKKVWEYIKEHGCQDQKNKRLIVPDAKLAKIIGKDPIDMMKLAGHLGKHLS
ncbi:MAG: type I DNA topoisomerase [Rhabdochlamydiaceae bacterium]|nr:type I DNA topoisomerase [Rhabdochlamydiaceae bacterium]